MIANLIAFGAFWYGFIIGDDWTIALGVIIALAVTYGISPPACRRRGACPTRCSPY